MPTAGDAVPGDIGVGASTPETSHEPANEFDKGVTRDRVAGHDVEASALELGVDRQSEPAGGIEPD
eukprot:scaffold647277_cov13-Prasinocladus_malaysianus.AAC.1